MNKLEIIKHFKSILPCEQFVVTGSYILNMYGLTENQPKDIDIILVKPIKEIVDIVKNLEISSPVDSEKKEVKPSNLVLEKPKNRPQEGLLARTMFDGIKIDFFITQKVQKTVKTIDFEAALVKDIVAAKLSYSRTKDLVQLYKMANNIISTEDFLQCIKEADGIDEYNEEF